jgi:hypothetical protein
VKVEEDGKSNEEGDGGEKQGRAAGKDSRLTHPDVVVHLFAGLQGRDALLQGVIDHLVFGSCVWFAVQHSFDVHQLRCRWMHLDGVVVFTLLVPVVPVTHMPYDVADLVADDLQTDVEAVITACAVAVPSPPRHNDPA